MNCVAGVHHVGVSRNRRSFCRFDIDIGFLRLR
jgi:hypothetical protein